MKFEDCLLDLQVPKERRFYLCWSLITGAAYAVCITVGQGTALRAYFGDVITVSLLHCSILLIFRFPPWKVLSFVVGLFVLMEVGQSFHYIRLLGWQDSELARTILGTTFCPIDLMAYGLGAGLVFLKERCRS